MTYTSGEKQEILEKMANPNVTLSELAADYKVPIRTLQSWAQQSGLQRRRVRRKARMETIDADWSDRIWKSEWNSSTFRRVGYAGQEPEVQWATVKNALSENMRWLIWYERRIIELRQKLFGDEPELLDLHIPTVNWFYALAGLPVLCEWLNIANTCDPITKKIREYKAWRSSKFERRIDNLHGRFDKFIEQAAPIIPGAHRRIAYRSSVRGPAAVLIRSMERKAFDLSIQTSGSEEIPRAIHSLNALAERVPMFDQRAAKSPYRDMATWRLFVDIFRIEPPRETS